MTWKSPANDDLRRRVDHLTAAVIEGRITPAEQEELAQLLGAQPAAQEAFLQQLEVEAMLRSREYRVAAASPSEPAPVVVLPPVEAAWGTKLLRSALGICLVLAAAVGLFVALRPERVPQRLAQIEHSENAHWGDEREALLPEDGIGAGRLSLASGTAHLTTAGGVELTLTAPCLVEFLDAKAVKVHDGRVTARINNEAAIGFRVLTPSMDLVDLGTEFGVLVEQDGSSEVHVFQGVVVARALGAEQVVPIYRDEAGRVAAEPRSPRDAAGIPVSRPTALVAVAARRDLFGRQTAERENKPAAQPAARLPADARVLLIGDPYLGADTPLLLLEQAWHDAGHSAAPRVINGFVPDWVHQYTQRFEHHVLRFHPTHVVVSFGPQYATTTHKRILPDQFGKDLAELVDRLTREGIEPVLTTGYRLRANQAEAQHNLDEYNEQVRQLARSRGLRLADVDEHFASAGNLDSLVSIDGRLLSFGGSRVLVAALLEAFGESGIDVPERLELRLLPGVITDWQYQSLPKGCEPLTAATAGSLAPDATWTALRLPQDDRFTPRLAEPSHSPLYCERSSGFATHLGSTSLPVQRAASLVRADAERKAFLHVGAATMQVWLNGEKVFDESVLRPIGHGRHPGYETQAIQLRAGENRLVVECSGSFFVSITDQSDPPCRDLDSPAQASR